MKSPEVFIRFAFCSSVNLCGTNREQIFRLRKSPWTMVCAVTLLMPNSSAINLSVSRRFWASICRTFSDHFWGSACRWPTRKWLILSRILPFEKVFEPFVNAFSAHGFPRTPAPILHASPLKFSPICSRIWCLHVAPLRCDTTSHTDYVQLAAVGLHCRSHAVHAVCRFSPCLWRTMRMRAHMCQVAVLVWHHSPNFLDTHCSMD